MFKGTRDGADKVDMYYIKELLPYPAGFIKINGTCQCYETITAGGCYKKGAAKQSRINQTTMVRSRSDIML